MSTRYPSSAISIMCDCPYTGKTREVNVDPGSDKRKKEKLRNNLKHTKESITATRNDLMIARKRLATFQRILTLELGWINDPYSLRKTTWKDRVREVGYLKSELIHLIDYLRQCDPRYRGDLAAHPTRLSASTEDLLSVAQERALKKLYHDRTVYHSEKELKTGESLREFMKLKENYEAKLHHNKIMEREIVNMKQKISQYQGQFLEDKCLIDYISRQHFKMKGCFLEAFPEDDSNERIPGAKSLDSEAENFKILWEQSAREKTQMLTSVQALSAKLKFANQKIIRAESACAGNIVAFKLFTGKMKDGTLFSKLHPKRKAEFGKFSAIQFRAQKSQLEAVINENKYLRKFLMKAVLSKKEDLERFQESLQSTATKYKNMLEAIRNSETSK